MVSVHVQYVSVNKCDKSVNKGMKSPYWVIITNIWK